MFITDYKNVQIVIADGRREISTSYRALQNAYNVSCMCVCVCVFVWKILLTVNKVVDMRFAASHSSAFALMNY